MRIKVSATSANLGPGFDCLGLALNLFNEVSITPAKETSVQVRGEGAEHLSANNLFVQVFRDFYEQHSKKKENFSFCFHNEIPISRGLGSSSAAIVGALFSVNEILGLNLSEQALLNEALNYENHPDNLAPAIYGGFVCTLVDEKNKAHIIKAPLDEDLRALVIIPQKAISTQKSRAMLAQKVNFKDAVFNLSHASFLTACFLSKKYDLLALASKDKLHQDVRMKELSELFSVQKCALENGALMSTLSGSGSSFFNLAHKDTASFLEQKLKDKFSDFKVLCLNFNNNGFEICEKSQK